MDYRRLFVVITAQAGVFAMGAVAWVSLGHALYATSLLCGLAAGLLAYASATQIFRQPGHGVPRRQTDAGAIYTAELSRRRLQVLLDQTPSPLLLLPDDGQVIAVNRAARKLFNVAYALPVATKRRLLGDGGDFGRTGGQVTWQGATYALEHTTIEGRDEASQLVVMTDISAEVRAAEATVLRDLLRVLNHELMNALTPVTSMSRTALEVLKEGKPQGPARAIRALERIVARTDGLAQFLNAYRTLTRLPPPDLAPVGLSAWLDVMRESFEAQWDEKGVTLDIRALADLRAVMDADQMWLCVGNLLNNAAQAALAKPEPRVRLELDVIQGRPTFRVQDSGPGIAPDREAQIFLPFYTTKANGSGVGLSLARQVVQSHGGQLRLVFERTADDLDGACFAFDIDAPAEAGLSPQTAS
ncbi:sensor histidine kinase [Asticcacaulis solisilvae]|uniref:sensor histidine kinase n=1 Tax=Asticcacaulis solisilvae TaxID=1217274 RepID=UPI003FD6EBA5